MIVNVACSLLSSQSLCIALLLCCHNATLASMVRSPHAAIHSWSSLEVRWHNKVLGGPLAKGSCPTNTPQCYKKCWWTFLAPEVTTSSSQYFSSSDPEVEKVVGTLKLRLQEWIVILGTSSAEEHVDRGTVLTSNVDLLRRSSCSIFV